MPSRSALRRSTVRTSLTRSRTKKGSTSSRWPSVATTQRRTAAPLCGGCPPKLTGPCAGARGPWAPRCAPNRATARLALRPAHAMLCIRVDALPLRRQHLPDRGASSGRSWPRPRWTIVAVDRVVFPHSYTWVSLRAGRPAAGGQGGTLPYPADLDGAIAAATPAKLATASSSCRDATRSSRQAGRHARPHVGRPHLLGIGVGWLQGGVRRDGATFENRGRRTDEYIAAMRELWSADVPNFAGRYVSFKDAVSSIDKPCAAACRSVISSHPEAAAKARAAACRRLLPLDRHGVPCRCSTSCAGQAEAAEQIARSMSVVAAPTCCRLDQYQRRR